jgi:t-SNARE complex subunit (syntaxin)
MLDETTLKEKQDGKTADTRIRQQQHAVLSKRFVDQLREYQLIRDKYREDSKKRIERQIKIVNPSATDEEIEEILDKPNSTSMRVRSSQVTRICQ